MDQDKTRIMTAVRSETLDATVVSRRHVAMGLGLLGALLAAPKLFVSSADAKAMTPEAAAAPAPAKDTQVAAETQVAEARPAEADADGELTDVSSQYWRRRRWRRRYWRRRYWRPRVWRRRYWRRRWRRRYW